MVMSQVIYDPDRATSSWGWCSAEGFGVRVPIKLNLIAVRSSAQNKVPAVVGRVRALIHADCSQPKYGDEGSQGSRFLYIVDILPNWLTGIDLIRTSLRS